MFYHFYFRKNQIKLNNKFHKNRINFEMENVKEDKNFIGDSN